VDTLRTVAGELGERLLLLDFDHTLLAANSTTEYLRRARPVVLVNLLLLVVNLVPWRRLTGASWFRFRDWAAILAVTLLTPWNLWRWRRDAPRLFAELCHVDVAEALAAVPREQTIIVSFGLDLVVQPLLRGTSWESCRRVCTPMFPGSHRLRSGKLDWLRSTLTEGALATAVVVTDSLHDADLLDHVEVPVLVPPAGGPREYLYYPLRYTALAKYSPRYVASQTLIVEFALLLLATWPGGFGWSWAWFFGASALFASAITIYEIGYFENDQRAASREDAPTLTPRAARFRDMPLSLHAWVWGVILGAAGAYLVTLAVVGAVDTTFLAYAMAAWLAVLLVLRLVFGIYNRVDEQRRVLLYPVLQAVKLFSPLVLLPATVVGVAVLLAQVVAMWITYAVYRSGGDKSVVPRGRTRMVMFLVALAGVLLLAKDNVVAVDPVQLVLIAGWFALLGIRPLLGRSLRRGARRVDAQMRPPGRS
jgi:hypothetical protein